MNKQIKLNMQTVEICQVTASCRCWRSFIFKNKVS